MNKTGTILTTDEPTTENMYNIFDNALYITRMTSRLHETTINCLAGGKAIFK